VSALDQLLQLAPIAARKALTPRESNVALHPAAVPATIHHGTLKHKDDAGPPGGGGPPVRVVAVLGPGATFQGLAETLLPVYAKAGVAQPLDRDDLAKGLVFYNRDFLPAATGAHYRVGLCLPLPIEIEASGAWTVNADEVRKWAASFLTDWRPRLSAPPARLPVREPAKIEGEAEFLLSLPGTPATRAAPLWTRVLRNPYEEVLVFYAVLHQLQEAEAGRALTFALATVDGAQPHQLALLAATTAGNGILRRIAQALQLPPPPDTSATVLAAARTLVDNALFQGPPAARTLVAHRELPETVDLLAVQPGSAKAVPGAKADPAGGLHRVVLGRDVGVGRDGSARVAGVTFTGPAFEGRLLLGPFLAEDARGLEASDPTVAGPLALLALEAARTRPLDAVKAQDAGLLSVGLDAWSALDPAGLPALLFKFKELAPDEFDLFFAVHGLDVERDPADATRFRLRRIGADGRPSTVMDAAALRTFLGGTVDATGNVTFGSDWAARFRLPALVSRRYRRAQVLLAKDRVKRAADPIELAVASVSPFPSAYRLDHDPGKSTALVTRVNADLTPVLTARHGLGLKSADTLAGAVYDLSAGPPPVKPAYAGFEDDKTFYVGSMGKLAALYAAHELWLRVGRAAKAANDKGLDVAVAGGRLRFLKIVEKTWSGRVARGFPGFDTRMPARFPKLGEMFTFGAGGTVGFKKGTATVAQITTLNLRPPTPNMLFSDLMLSMILMSNAFAAARVIDAVGYPYLNGVLREGGFFDPKTNKGIWVSGNYGDGEWRPGPDVMTLSARGKLHYRPVTNFAGDARQFARLLALAARRELFDKDVPTCDAMLKMLQKDGIPGADNCFVRVSVERTPEGVGGRAPGTPELVVDKFASKIGIGEKSAPSSQLSGVHDCAVIERHQGPPAPGGTTLRYVAVFVGGYSNFELPAGVGDPETGTYNRFVQGLDGAVAAAHP
jgi:hypothetical protein